MKYDVFSLIQQTTQTGLSLPFFTRPHACVPFDDIPRVVSDAITTSDDLGDVPAFGFVHEFKMGIPVGAQDWMSEFRALLLSQPYVCQLRCMLTDVSLIPSLFRSEGGSAVDDQAEAPARAVRPAQARPSQPDGRSTGPARHPAKDHTRRRLPQGRRADLLLPFGLGEEEDVKAREGSGPPARQKA